MDCPEFLIHRTQLTTVITALDFVLLVPDHQMTFQVDARFGEAWEHTIPNS